MNNLIVREAKQADADAIATIHVQTWQCAYRGQIPDEYLANLSIEKRKQFWSEATSKPHDKSRILVAELDGEVAGFCGGGPSRDEDADKTIGEVYSIYIDQNKMGRGAGTALMKNILTFLKDQGFVKVTLWVLSTNQITKRFYKNHGWKPDGKTKSEINKGITFNEERYIIDL